jgi:hypothetical protein
MSLAAFSARRSDACFTVNFDHRCSQKVVPLADQQQKNLESL